MMPLHQDLELSLDIGARGVTFKPEYVQRPALGIEDFAALGCRARLSRPPGRHALEQAERIVGRPAGPPRLAAAAARFAAAAAHATDRPHLPSRPMAGDVFF